MSRRALQISTEPGRRTTALVCFVLAALSFLIFAQALRFGFVALDDNLFVDRNPALEAGLSWRGLSWAFTANLTHLDGRAEYWEPLTLVTRLADYQFFGFAPWGHHLTSLLIHLATGLALFGALQQLTSAFWRSALVAALFLVHPMHVEPVVWLSARKDLVSGLFYVLTIWAYGWFVAGQSRRRYAVFFAAFVAANMAKPMAVSLPAVLLLLDFWPLRRLRLDDPNWRRATAALCAAKLPLCAISLGVSVLAYVVQKDIGAVADDGFLPMSWRIGAAIVSIGTYLLKALVPTDLTLFYPHPGRDLSIVQAVGVGAGLALLTALVLANWRRRPWLTFGWLWFLVVIAPVSGIIQVGDQAMADRYSYLSFIGIFVAVVWQFSEWASHGRELTPRAATALAGTFISFFTAMACTQVQTWRSSESVFTHALIVTDENHLAHFNLGAVLWAKGRRDEARDHFAEAVRIRRPFLEYQMRAANEALGRGAVGEAIPHLVRVLMLTPWNSELHQDLGTLLVCNGEPGKALAQFSEALKYRPDWVQPRLSISEVLIAQGQPARAQSFLQEVLRADPENSRAKHLIALLSEAKNKMENTAAPEITGRL